MGCKAAEGDFVISEIAKWAVLKGLPARKMTNMTIMTNDSVIFGGETDDENMRIMPLLYIIYILYIIMDLEQSFRPKGVGGNDNCHLS